MSVPKIPPKLGRPVSSRNFSYRDLVLRSWGPDFNKPDTAYQFSSGSRFDCTDKMTSGIYKRR